MLKDIDLDNLFHQAVTAIDEGDEKKLNELLEAHPQLVARRLTIPGKWLTGKIPGPLKGFFKDPYLLWFVAEDPVRNGTLPSNIADIARIIIDKAKSQKSNFQEQIDYALKLVAWSIVARNC